ncbi:MAG: hypothetical protein IKD59_05430 [Lachnospiraceae bacterium]|nr:hypothetical protein [Lachnospiraceae bacterium]
MPYSEAQKRATIKYKNENMKRVELNFNRKTEADLVAFVEGTENVSGEIKRLIRARIEGDIFTNRQTNLLKTCISFRVNMIDNWIEEDAEIIKKKEGIIDKHPDMGGLTEHHQREINRCQAEIEKLMKERKELCDLREYIEHRYYKND